MTYQADSPEARLGAWGEDQFSRWLALAGWLIYKRRNCGPDGRQAPAYEGHHQWFLAPDIEAAKRGISAPVEIKTKRAFTFYRKAGVAQHGIDYFHLTQYVRFQRETGHELILVVVEINSCADDLLQLSPQHQRNTCLVFGQRLTRLVNPFPRIYFPPGADAIDSRGAMAYWNRDTQFIRLGSLHRQADELDLRHFDILAAMANSAERARRQ